MPDVYRRIGVIGAGVMGRGIAQVFAQAGAEVVLVDQSKTALVDAMYSLQAILGRAVAKGRVSEEAAAATLARIHPVDDLAALAGHELVVEAIVEDLAVKARVLNEVARHAPLAVLATNTSSLQISGIAAALDVPNPLIGMYFFNPAPVMKLVEVIFLPTTPAAVRARVFETLQKAGKHPVICADTPGFIVNRCARPFYGEALAILEENTHSAAEIDAAMTRAGYRIGPFALIDLIGADVHLAATQGVAQGFDNHPRYHVFDALKDNVSAGRLGRKSGAGFVTPAVEVMAPADAEQIVERIEAMLVNEAVTLWNNADISHGDIDTALMLGLNFPRGPFAMAESIGIATVRERLAKLRELAPDAMKPRYDPAPGLDELEAR
ncbi:MAG: 3-hydroxybutyryl-CoA dehydrogenase [Rhodobacteraceae bacterium]|nr:3-hydroxybutyryl-CoA dehydrogenase [Paracoccaceae bacterium]